MLTLKNNHLMMNIHLKTRRFFLKFCYFSVVLFCISCKTDVAKVDKVSAKTITETTAKATADNTSKRIVFFGDSLTAGYGLSDVDDAFPGIIQSKIDSLQLNYTVVNSGISGETSAGGKNRIDWVLNEKPAIFILELGANDGLRGLPLSETKKNLQAIIDAVKSKYTGAKIVLAGMQIPPNMGQDYTTEFKNIFPDLAYKNDIALIPFLLENVGGIAKLNQSDGIHPTKVGHQILAKNVWEILANML